ncbi:MAG TPA: reverse gyrase [Ignisphaera aggregans]|uniref:Reverse gyrase n=1 Tax=Ignisphaera aggregans TaxID=334771 RepID=A0A833DU56_9CREN|nr:reverse gyrase [Ignisphaera aggregans]
MVNTVSSGIPPVVRIEVRSKEDLERLNLSRGIYQSLCINCGGEIDDVRLLYRNACSRCMRTPEIVKVMSFSELAKYVKDVKPGSKLEMMIKIEEFVNGLEDYFVKSVGSKPWSIQRSWMYRIAQRQSFAMIAPTGVGKTTFGLVAAIYMASMGMKTYIVVPTTVLVMQYEERLLNFISKLMKDPHIAPKVRNIRVLAIHSKIPSKKRIELENAVRQGEFEILITTSNYLQRKFDTVFKPLLSKNMFIDFVFVDDVDAIMKGSKAIELILKLIGFDDNDIKLAYDAIDLKQRMTACERVLHEYRRVCREVELGRKSREAITEIIEKHQRCFVDGKPIDLVLEDIHRTIVTKRQRCGFLVLSSATGKARGKRVRLFRELLGFSIGTRAEVYRNIVDTYIIPKESSIEELVLRLVKRLGSGGLIFVSADRGIEYAEQLAAYLRENGILADTLVSGKQLNLVKFAEGALDVLVGVAVYYGLLTRGIDLPERVRYAIFVGVPRHKVSLTRVEYSPATILRLISVLVEVVPETYRSELTKLATVLRRIMRRLSPKAVQSLVERVEQGEVSTKYEEALKKAHDMIAELLSKKEIIEALQRSPRTAIIREGDQLYILIPDAPTYIQASGRTSRLFAGGVTRGLSIVIVDDMRLLHGLEHRLKLYIEDFRFVPFDELNLEEVLRQIDEDRAFVREVRSGRVMLEHLGRELVKTALLVVESPNKARTIAKFFGRPSTLELDGIRAYEVDIGSLHLIIVASGGHVFDIVEEDISANNIYGVLKVPSNGKVRFLPVYGYLKRCLLCGHQFVKGEKCPLCGSTRIKDSKTTIEVLQRLALEVDEVLIGTDPDAEGEKIGYDIALALAPYAKEIKRIEFHEVTRKAILNALNSPRGIDMRLVEAQITRRVEDRWIGFALSNYVTMKLSELLQVKGRLSAGRVQTPTLGRVIELFLHRLKSMRKSVFLYVGNLVIEIPRALFESAIGEKVRKVELNKLKVVLKPVQVEVVEIPPPPPFTTDTLLAEASQVFGFGAPETMRLAQELFEMGLITYHRTDSTRISPTGIGIAREYLQTVFSDEAQTLFVPRTWGEGGAHEGIRPTRPIDSERLRELIAEGVIELAARITSKHYQLYDLIFRRFIASQMRSAVVERTTYLIEVYYVKEGMPIKIFETTASIITDVLYPGFMLIYMPLRVMPLPKEIVELTPHSIKSKSVSDVVLPSQGDIVKWMREVGIGRPSTYAKIVEVLLRRGYVAQRRGKDVLVPRMKGMLVYAVLAGLNLPETRNELLSEIDRIIDMIVRRVKLRNVEPEVLKKVLAEAVKQAKHGIVSMVSLDRTSELQKAMNLIEKGEVEYEDVLNELFKEMCENLLIPEFKYVPKEVCTA